MDGKVLVCRSPNKTYCTRPNLLSKVCRKIVATAKLSFAVDEIHASNKKWTVKIWYCSPNKKLGCVFFVSFSGCAKVHLTPAESSLRLKVWAIFFQAGKKAGVLLEHWIGGGKGGAPENTGNLDKILCRDTRCYSARASPETGIS